MISGEISSLHPQLFFLLVSSLSAIAAWTDLRSGKVYNWLTLPGIVIGFMCGLVLGGFSGLIGPLLGCFVAFVCGVIPFAMSWLGAGDVKLLMALGSLGGVEFLVESILLSLFIGSLMGIVQLIAQGKLFGFLKRMQSFLRSRMIPGLEPESIRLDRTTTLPFAIPLGLGAAWTAWSHPVIQWGWLSWST